MKKIITLIAVLFCIASVKAQDYPFTTKDGKVVIAKAYTAADSAAGVYIIGNGLELVTMAGDDSIKVRNTLIDSIVALYSVKENTIGNPGTNGYYLTRNTDGTWVWVAGSGGGVDLLPLANTWTALNTNKGTVASDFAALGSELLTATWTSTNWTGDNTTGWVPTTTFTNPITNTLAAVVSTYYQITWTITGRSAGTINIEFGGVNSSNSAYAVSLLSTSGAAGIVALTTGTFNVTRTADFNGTVIFSVKEIGYRPAVHSWTSSDGAASIVNLRVGSSLGNLSMSDLGQRRLTTGTYVTNYGLGSANSITTAKHIASFGYNTLANLSIGENNSGFGSSVFQNLTTGVNNNGQGYGAGGLATTASYNNIQGVTALYNNVTGSHNIAIGNDAARYYTGSVALTTVNNGVYIGSGAKAFANSVTNEIAIGYNVQANGSNTFTHGNTSITSHYFNGTINSTGTSSFDSAPLGSELATTGTATNWTGTSFATGYTATATFTDAITTSLAAASGSSYQITYTINSRTAGSITITFGGVTSSSLTATGAWGPKATTTGTLSVQRTSDFDGQLILSVKLISGAITPLWIMRTSAGAISTEFRGHLSNTNISGGFNALQLNTTGTDLTAYGRSALSVNTTGSANTALGAYALIGNTSGGLNTAVGVGSLGANISGTGNNGFGFYALNANTTGSYNQGFGYYALGLNTTGNFNNATGRQALGNMTSGDYNVGIGYQAGYYITDGTTANAIANNSIFLGSSTKALASSQTNQIVIGHGATGLGSNTSVLGNSSTLTTKIYGITSQGYGSSVASASAITATGNIFHVTGTTAITSINGTNLVSGATITIIFDGVLTFTDGSNLKLAGNFTTAADATITLVYDGTNFYETDRSTN